MGWATLFRLGRRFLPGNTLVLAKSTVTFAAAYGATIPVFDQFGGGLTAEGETLSLIQPGGALGPDVVVDRVRYETNAPWPVVGSYQGASLQLVDPAQDNSRVSNWAVSQGSPAATPGARNNVAASLTPYPALWLNEVVADNLTGATDDFGARGPWVELYNSGTNSISLDQFYLASSYTNLGQWAFPAGATISPGQFLLVWADGQSSETAGTNLHANFRLTGGTGSVVLSTLLSNQVQIVDYLNYQDLPSDQSYGDVPDGQPFYRQEMFFATPRQTNSNAQPPITVVINEWLAANSAASGIVDPADGHYNDWFELYNPSTNAANLAGCFLTDDPTSTTKFQIPSGFVVAPAGFLLVWADKEPAQNTNGQDLHVNFRLNKGGEFIGLFAADGSLVSSVAYGPQTENVSQGHFPDGSGLLYFMPVPTPGSPNRIPNTAPILATIPAQLIYDGQMLRFSASATDNEIATQTLTFSLGPGAPVGASINPTTGAFTWLAQASDLPATNSVTIQVTDNGVPPLSDTKTFAVVVLSPPPLIGTLQPTDGMVTLSFSSLPGQVYQLEVKDSLNAPTWSPLGAPLTGTGEVLAVSDALSGQAQRFYRLVVLP